MCKARRWHFRNLDLERRVHTKTIHRVKNLGPVSVSGTNGKCWRSAEERENTEGQYGRTFLKELDFDMSLHRKAF
mgnify:CR=1 FL=1